MLGTEQNHRRGHFASLNIMSTSTPPPPPKGYTCWLDYAVESFDTRSAALHTIYDDVGPPDRGSMREAARAELQALRRAAQERQLAKPPYASGNLT